jgi:3-hydroxyisobutyrate dehydrogenase-like beta-hydroxyacid dehydrogenase
MEQTVALYGLGNMGFPLAKRLAQTFTLQVHDIDTARCAKAANDLSAMVIEAAGDIARTRFIVLCLPHPQASRAVIATIRDELREDAVIIETSTVNPDDMTQAAALLEGRGARIIDASILAGISQMEAGTATLALGGDADALEAAKPVLDAIAPRQVVFGALGSGAAAKVINNAVAHAVMVVVAEAGAMATASGVDIDALVKVLSDSEMGLHRPLTFRYAQRIAQGDYAGGMPLAAARKDSELALALAQQAGVPIFAIQSSHSVYEMAAGAGYGREDYAVIAKLWEGWGTPAYPPASD